MNSLIELAALVLALASPVTVALCYSSLPARVPIHFGFKGEADGWGARPMIWLLPAIGLVMYVMLTVLPLLDPKAGAVGRMVQLLKLEILAMFLFILRGQIRVALGQAQRLGPAIWLFLVIVMGTSFAMGPIAEGARSRDRGGAGSRGQAPGRSGRSYAASSASPWLPNGVVGTRGSRAG